MHVKTLLDLFVYKFQTKIDGTDADDEEEDRIAHFDTEYELIAEGGSIYPLWRYGSLIHTWIAFIYSTATVVTTILAIFGIAIEVNYWTIYYLSMAEGLSLMGFAGLWAMNWYLASGIVKEDAEDDGEIETDMMWSAIEEAGLYVFMLRYSQAWGYGMDKLMDGDEMKDGEKGDGKREDGEGPRGPPEGLFAN